MGKKKEGEDVSLTLGMSAACSAGASKKRLPPRCAMAKPEIDELEEYLAEPEETDLELNVLVWSGGRPRSPSGRRLPRWSSTQAVLRGARLSSAPGASSASGARLLRSWHRKMHGGLQKSAKDSTLEHSLFAAFNTD